MRKLVIIIHIILYEIFNFSVSSRFIYYYILLRKVTEIKTKANYYKTYYYFFVMKEEMKEMK